ncbi:transposase [Pararhizobium sp. DWP3-4]|uniref:transposase n=1 Tax=Pararhizobium sp. DWP3-4 TaxID=2804565 RepID=UPI003CF3E2B9
MAHLFGSDRSQLLLLPEAVDDYVGSDNPVCLIEAFVDSIDLVAAGFSRVTARETGRPGYDPADLLKLYLYGYLNRVRSSRKLEAETRRNIEVIWLLRHLKPDYRKVASFRRANCAAFKQIFREFAIVCRRLDLFGREMLAVDGTRIKAVNNRHRNFTRTKLLDLVRRADEKLSDYVKALDDGDADEEKAASSISSNGRSSDTEKKIAALRTRRQKFSSLLAELDRMAERLSQRPHIMSQRKESVEHPFGTIKQWMNQGAFLMRGLNHVQGEFSLTAVAYNIRRAIALVSIPDLIGAMKA